MTPRSEPLLWLQLLAFGAIPLELLLLLLLLAGADPGPVPAVERLLVWAIAVLGPALLFWRRPPDVCSLLLIQVPLRGRSAQQRGLAALQTALIPRLMAAAGAALLLPLFWTLDRYAALAATLSPLSASNRFIVLLLSIPLLTLVLWQWHQLTQSLWLLSRPAGKLVDTAPLSSEAIEAQRVCLGLPLLLLPALISPEPPPAPMPMPAEGAPAPPPTSALDDGSDEASDDVSAASTPTSEPEPEPETPPEAEPEKPEESIAPGGGEAVAVEPEQPPEDPDSSELDQDVS